jgi:plastocyanin
MEEVTAMSAVQTRPAARETGDRLRPAYTAVAAFGLLLIALAPLVILVIGLATGMRLDGGIVMFLPVPAIVAMVAAALVWRFGTWATVLGAFVSVLAALTLFWLAFGIAVPASFGDFVPALLFTVGVPTGLGGSIAAIVQRRRGRLRVEATTGERRIIAGAAGLIMIAALASAVLWFTTGTTVDTAAADATATMRDFAFQEGAYQVTSGDTIAVHNADGFVHDFTVHELGIAADVAPGSGALVAVPDEPGTYVIYCTLHSNPEATDASDGDMVATLVIR